MKWFAAALAIFITPIVSADIIIFEHRSNSSVTGQVGAQQFNSPFTITAIGDTDDRERFGNLWRIPHLSASIFIDKLNASFDFITPTRSFVGNVSENVSLARTDTDLTLFFGPTHPEFGEWDMTTSIGPLSGRDGALFQWEEPFQTTGGILSFDILRDLNVTFTATVIPVPGTLALLGVAGLVARRRRRKHT